MTPQRAPEQRELLRFLTCGSVDDGKSTLIGRLLFDSQLIFEDTLAAITKDSRKHGTTGEDVDLALLVDGLEAERQQGITIDVAYRFFQTPRRAFIVADTPGHEQYTRNMATGASGASLAVILIDARKGVLTQTRRHSYICSLLGIRDIVVAVNKIDLVNFSEETFDRIVGDYVTFASGLGFGNIMPVPMSARFGDNVTARSGNMPWYHGPTLLEHLETVDVSQDLASRPFRFPVQWVNRPNLDFRGFAGTMASGRIAQGDQVVVAASGKTSRVARIVTADGDLPVAEAGQAVTLTLEDEVDVARGDMLVRPTERPEVADQFAAHLLWMDEEAMLPGRRYLMRIGNVWTPCSVTSIRHRVDVNTLEEHAARSLALNEIGFCNFSAGQAIPLDPYAREPPDRRLHPGGPLHQPHRGRGHGGLSAAPGVEHPPRAFHRGQGGARRAGGQCADGAVVHRPVGLGQVHHRQHRGTGAAQGRARDLFARWRQCPPRAVPRPRLHRGRPGREHPPRRRGLEAVRRCRDDRAVLLHLALPRGATDGARPARRRANSPRCSWTRRSRPASRATPRASMPRRRRGRSRTSPASTAPMRHPNRRSCTSAPPGARPRIARWRCWTGCARAGIAC